MVDSPFELLPIGIRFMASLVFNPPQFGQVLQEMRVVSVQFFLFCSCPCLYYTKFLLRELVLEAAGRQAKVCLSRSRWWGCCWFIFLQFGLVLFCSCKTSCNLQFFSHVIDPLLVVFRGSVYWFNLLFLSSQSIVSHLKGIGMRMKNCGYWV